MRLERLDIQQLPGLDAPVSVRFDPDAVNFITGPNASGKSSIVRAVRALLYPERQPDVCHVIGTWQADGRVLRSERHGQTVTWLEDDQPAPPPRLPGVENLGAYLVSSEDLVEFGDTETHIATRMRTLLAGGYDLDAVLEDPALTLPPRPQKRWREMTELERRIRLKEDEYGRLAEELRTLDQLDRELTETADAGSRLRACEDALALADAIAARNALEHNLIEEYPDGMDRLRGDELTRLDEIESQLDDRQRERQLTGKSLARAEHEFSDNGATDPARIEALQADLTDIRDQLAELERDIDERKAALNQALSDRETAARRLGRDRPELGDELGQDELEQLERLVDRVMTLREKVRTLSGELARNHGATGSGPHSEEQLRRARQALVDWLAFCRLSPLEGVLWGGLGLTALLAGWRVLGPQDLEVVPELILLILIAVGTPAGLLARFIERYRQLSRSHDHFAATGVEGPLGWTESEVETCIDRLDRELEQVARSSVRQARAQEIRERLNNEREALDQAREKLNTHARQLGLDAEARLETGFLLWCRHLQDWQRAERQVTHIELALERALARHDQRAARAADRLAEQGIEPPDTPAAADLSAMIHQLAPRARALAERHNEIRSRRQRLEELDADLEQLQAQRDALYQRAGLDPGDRETLTRRIEQFENWRSLEQQRRDRSLEVKRLENRLEGDAQLLEHAREQRREALEALRDSLEQQARRRDELNRDIATLHARHGDLLERRELETMTGERESQRQALLDELDHHLRAEAGRMLIEDVRSAHEADNEPVAMAHAARWFERFTHHRYRLKLTSDRFEAIDTRAGQPRAIAELSTATRMQLLLALRLAWIEQAERGSESLPVFLDEVLTTSDPDRYHLVVASIQEIAAAGRQMFYLTAQADEAAVWAARDDAGPAPHVIDMAEVRRGQVEPLRMTLSRGQLRRRELPEPGDRQAEDWAREAGIGAINPWAGSGMIETFHLLHDDLELVVRLIRGDLERLGELQAALDAGLDGVLLTDDEQSRLRHRASAAARVLRDWQVRHHRPVDAATLDASGLISDTFMPRVLKLNDSVGGDPRRLVDALRDGRVSRFRADVTDQLEQWLLEHGYLARDSDRPALSAAELASRTGLDVEEAANVRDWIVGAINDPLAKQPTAEATQD